MSPVLLLKAKAPSVPESPEILNISMSPLAVVGSSPVTILENCWKVREVAVKDVVARTVSFPLWRRTSATSKVVVRLLASHKLKLKDVPCMSPASVYSKSLGSDDGG